MVKKLITFVIILAAIPLAAEESAPGHPAEHHAIHHHGAIFLGTTHSFYAEHTDFTLGAEYELRFSDRIGAGLFAEMVFAAHQEQLVGIPLLVHFHNLKLFAGPGMVFIQAEHHGHKETHSEFLVRTGAGYDIHLGSASISPTFSLDFINGHLYAVPGIGFGIGF
jgi:hypothetical protein